MIHGFQRTATGHLSGRFPFLPAVLPFCPTLSDRTGTAIVPSTVLRRALCRRFLLQSVLAEFDEGNRRQDGPALRGSNRPSAATHVAISRGGLPEAKHSATASGSAAQLSPCLRGPGSDPVLRRMTLRKA